jgi:hypothetical protein
MLEGGGGHIEKEGKERGMGKETTKPLFFILCGEVEVGRDVYGH